LFFFPILAVLCVFARKCSIGDWLSLHQPSIALGMQLAVKAEITNSTNKRTNGTNLSSMETYPEFGIRPGCEARPEAIRVIRDKSRAVMREKLC